MKYLTFLALIFTVSAIKIKDDGEKKEHPPFKAWEDGQEGKNAYDRKVPE